MGLFSFVGGLLGAGSQKKAVKKATQQQVDALNASIAEQRRQFDTTNANFAPYREAGTAALGSYTDLVGGHGDEPQAAAIAALKASPFYQSLFRTGEENVLQTASATGGLRGGNTQTSLADFGADTLMKTIQQQLASYGALISTGVGATNSTANFGQQTANNVSNDITQQGQARASGSLAIGGINSQMWNNLGGFLDGSGLMGAISKFLPGGGGGSLIGSNGSFNAGGF